MLSAFRSKMRQDSVAWQASDQDPKVYETRVSFTRELASILRRNIVQGERVQGEEDTWRLRLTQHTELGVNETIKNPTPMPRSGGKRVKCCSEPEDLSEGQQNLTDEHSADSTTRTLSLNYSKLKKVHRQRNIPQLEENDLEESFVRGSGPGGQSINKTENNVQLLHKPTGIRVQCQETRSLQTNRMLARRKLLEKLDGLQNPGMTKGDVARAKQRERERQRKKKARKKQKARSEDDSDLQ